MIRYFFKIFLILPLLHISCLKAETTFQETTHKKAVFNILQKIKNKRLSTKERLLYTDSLYVFSIEFKNDSLRNLALKNYVKLYYKEKQWEQFHKYRLKHIKLNSKNTDTLSLAKTLIYSGAYFNKKAQVDSAYYYYYKSYKLYESIKDSLNASSALINIAIIQKNTRDYVGSEISSFNALTFLKSNPNSRRVSSIYNNLGLTYAHLSDMENAIKYHTKSLEERKKISNNQIYFIHSLNNIGKAYKKNQQYTEALTYFKKALAYDSILITNPRVKSILLNNYTHTLFKKGKTKNSLNSFLKTLSVLEKENDIDGIVINCIYIAEYYNELGEKETALKYAKRAEKLSKSTQNYHDYLLSIELLSNLQDTKEAKDHYFKRYRTLRDSLDLVARKHKEQFARIRFDTNEKENVIQKQGDEIKDKKNTIFIIICVAALMIISLITIYILRRKTQRKLKKDFAQGFSYYLKKKYALSYENLIFWEALTEGLNQNQISKKLHISIDAIKTRRRSLKNKINKIEKIDGNFDKTKAVILYNRELELYKTFIS